MVRTAEAAELADRTGDLGPHMAAQRLHVRRVRRVARQPAGGQASGARAAATPRCRAPRRCRSAISSEPPPMSRTSSFPADQPNQRRAARKVSRASSSPVRTARSTPVSSSTRASTSSALLASRTADVANGSTSSHALVLGGLQRVGDRRDQPVHAVGSDRPVLVEQFGQPQLRLVRMRGQRARAGVRVHHQQMNRVRTHVEDSESHTRHATAPADLRLARAKDEKGEAGQSHQEAENRSRRCSSRK